MMAVKSHASYVAEASLGKGCDRHLLGLRLCLAPGEETPAIFADYGYAASQRWLLSSSGLTSGEDLLGKRIYM